MTSIVRKIRDRRGISLVLTAMLLVALLGAVGLTVDMGRLYLARQYLANTCDAAALAGGMELPDQAQATLKADETAAENSEGPNRVSQYGVSFPDVDKIRVDGQMTVPLTFARILGFSQTNVSAYAVVLKTGPVSWVEDAVVPWGIPDINYVQGEPVTLKLGTQQSLQQNDLKGNFYPLALERGVTSSDTGADTYREDLMYGHYGRVSVGDVVATEPGNMVGPTREGVDYRYQEVASNPDWADDDCSQQDYGNPQVVIVPIVTVMGSGRTDVVVLGFAAFYITSIDGGSVTGCFIDYRIPNSGGSGPDYGVSTFRLIE